MNNNIIFTEPVYKDYIWGGTKIKEYFNRKVDMEKIAESWEVSANKDGLCKIKNSDLTLEELFQNKEKRAKLFGTKAENLDKFPLLIKFIDAKDNLSVQVHPNDEYAKKYENDTGKTEMWYIIDCKEDAKLICGMKENVKQEDIADIINQNKIKENLNEVPIQRGDVIYIPSGTVHAILGGILLCEVQQNSNLTYRVYDWDRVGKDGKPRELHIQKAIDVIDVNSKPQIKHTQNEECEVQHIVDSEYFKTDLLNVNGIYKDTSSKDTFYAIDVIEGEGKIVTNNENYNIAKGDSFIVPASLGEYKIEGNVKLLKSWI